MHTTLASIRADCKSTFANISIPVTTKHNTGRSGSFTNKCFFISVYDGLEENDICFFRNSGERITVDLLITKVNFNSLHEMIDTYNAAHRNYINKLVKILPQIKLHVFIGVKSISGWSTTIDPHAEYGKGSIVIRILNMGQHFEFINIDNNKFDSICNNKLQQIVPTLVSDQEKILEQIAFDQATKQAIEASLIEKKKESDSTLEELLKQQKQLIEVGFDVSIVVRVTFKPTDLLDWIWK